jgi:PAS domain S-box-containing protein
VRGVVKVRILILEDLDSDAELVASVVRKGGIDAEFVIARGRDEFLAALPAGADVIISDYTLPDFDAISAIRAVRASNRDVPVIVVTGTITEETAVNCIREGAADYLLKDQLGRLPSAVGRAVEMRSVRGKEALAKEALRESGSRWRSVAEAASDGIILADGEGVITSWNPEASAIFGYNSEEIVGKPLTALMPERYHAAHTAGLRRFLETGETRVIGRPIELVGRRKDGSEFPVDLSISTWSSGGRVCFSGIARDATQRKRAEDDLRRLNRALQTISDCNQALVRAADEPGLLEAICRVVVETGGHRAACVGYKVDDPGKSVKVAAQRGFDPEFIGRMDPSWDDSDRGRNTLGTAIRTGESVLVHEYQADPRFAAWSSQARDVGAVSVFTIPLRADGALIGALCIISGQPGAFDPEERKILEELADDLGYGIGAIRARDAKARADRDLEASAARLRDLLETVPVGIALVRTDATIVDVNSHMCRMLGFAAKEELKATKANEHFAEPRERDRFLGFLKEGAVSGFEARFRRSDGSLFWGSLSAVYRSGEAERTIILALQDVTERRRAETEQLQNARQHEAVARLGIAALESVDLAPLHSDVVETMARTLGVE